MLFSGSFSAYSFKLTSLVYYELRVCERWGSHCVILAGLALNSQIVCLLSAGTKAVCHHAWLMILGRVKRYRFHFSL